MTLPLLHPSQTVRDVVHPQVSVCERHTAHAPWHAVARPPQGDAQLHRSQNDSVPAVCHHVPAVPTPFPPVW